tara:strand:+ start:232 stop:657 length:426 start_codon:yes stop_codon:yes gene_type:complete
MTDLKSVDMRQKLDGSWEALHSPSGRVVFGETAAEAEQAMKDLLGMDEEGSFSDEPLTSSSFEGVAYDIALYLEGPVSKMLELHSGYARLEAWQDGIAHVRLGGGCEGCPSSLLTLANGVKQDLQAKFGEEVVMDVIPALG